MAARSSASTRWAAYASLRPARVPMNRRSCASIGRPPLGRLALQGAERREIAARLEDRLDPCRAEGSDQLVLEVRLADEEPEALELGPRRADRQPGPLERTPVVAFLWRIDESRQPQVEPGGAEPVDRVPDVLRAIHRDDRDPRRGQIVAAPRGERREGASVTDTLDEHDRANGPLDRREHPVSHPDDATELGDLRTPHGAGTSTDAPPVRW